MTTYNQTSLKTFFENGDVPTGQNYADFIDSCLNVADTSAQSMSGPLNVVEVITGRVSAGNGVFTGDLTVGGNFSINSLSVSAVTATSDISASAGSVYASALRTTGGLYQAVGIVSALGSTQATAAPLTFTINLGAGVADGVTTGFILQANRTGLEQKIINGTASANLYPCIGGQINALASNAAFAMAANTLYTIIHTRASGYAVK